MSINLWTTTAACALAVGLSAMPALAMSGDGGVSHVLLISIDGMHSVDFANCANGLPTVNGGAPYCPNLAALASTGLNYTYAYTTKPSDSFPGLIGLITGGTPRSTGTFYDVSYDRALSPPAQTTPYGIVGGATLCPGTVGTQVGFDEEIDTDYTLLNGGGGINPAYLPRDPKNGCAPVYPHTFIKMNTIFEVIKQAGGYTAWSDKHPSYDFANGPSGQGVDDLYTPEINSIPVALPQITRFTCNPLPDLTAVSSSNSWTDSFLNIRCYDELKVQAILHEIDGFDHTGTVSKPTPNIFGMNFQAVSVGEKLVENSLGLTGGYIDGQGAPSASLFKEIKYVDAAIGEMVNHLRAARLYSSTTIIVTAKHGQSPIDIKRLLRIPADNPNLNPPSAYVPNAVQADEDDISMLWLLNSSRTPSGIAAVVQTLETNAANIGASGGEIFYGPQLSLLFNANDSRTPDIIVAPDVGVVYTGGQGKVSEHGGWANDDTRVMLLASNPNYSAQSIYTPVQTVSVAPTILKLLGLQPGKLEAVRNEGAPVLPGF